LNSYDLRYDTTISLHFYFSFAAENKYGNAACLVSPAWLGATQVKAQRTAFLQIGMKKAVFIDCLFIEVQRRHITVNSVLIRLF